MKKRILIMFVMLTMVFSLVACGSKDVEDTSSDEPEVVEDEATDVESEDVEEAADDTESGGKKFGYTFWGASDFFTTIGESMQAVAQENGDEVIIGDAQQDQAHQISIIEDFITQGVSAVILNPVDRDGIEPALDMLNEAGIPIINVDSAVASIDKVDSYVASDNYGAGVLCGEKLIELFPDGGEIAILDFPANTAVLDRVQGFIDAIEGKGFEIVAQQDAQGKPGPGLDKTQDILQANPDIVAVFAGNDQCGQGAYAAINEAGSDAIVLGVDGSPEGKEYILEESAFVATAAQSPIKIGESSMETAYKILNGEDFEKEIAVPTFLIDITNVNDYLDGWQ